MSPVRPHPALLVPTLVVALTLSLVPTMLGACPAASTPREPDPAQAVIAYRDALVAGRPREALSWIHPDAREGLDERGFEALYQRHKDALIAQAEDLVRLVRSAPPAERARVRTDKGDALLVKEPAGWRLLAPVGAPTP